MSSWLSAESNVGFHLNLDAEGLGFAAAPDVLHRLAQTTAAIRCTHAHQYKSPFVLG